MHHVFPTSPQINRRNAWFCYFAFAKPFCEHLCVCKSQSVRHGTWWKCSRREVGFQDTIMLQLCRNYWGTER